MEFKYTDPASEFGDGLAVIRAYHDNLLVTGERLLKLSFKISHHGVGEAAAIEAIDLHQHYTRANTLHHADEDCTSTTPAPTPCTTPTKSSACSRCWWVRI